MKRGALILIGIFLGSGLSYYFFFSVATSETRELVEGSPERAGLGWLEVEFALSGKEMEDIRSVHERFLPICAQHCRLLAKARWDLARLSEDPRSSAGQLAKASEKVGRIEQECFGMSLSNIEEISGLLEAEKGARYRILMRSRLVEHRGPIRGESNELGSWALIDGIYLRQIKDLTTIGNKRPYN